jgi:dipeptidyl-peptidase-4
MTWGRFCIIKLSFLGDFFLNISLRYQGALSVFFCLLILGWQGPARSQAPTTANASGKSFTFQELFGPGLSLGAGGTLPSIARWRPDGEHYLQRTIDPKTREMQLVSVQAKNGTGETLFASGAVTRALKAAGADKPEAAESLADTSRLDASEARLLVDGDNDLWVYDRKTDKAVRLTNTPSAAEEEVSFSPDGHWVGFVRDNNLFVVPSDGSSAERALTSDGTPTLLNGRLDWVYEEEVYGRGNTNGYSWSPDSRQIAFLRTDDSPIKPFSIIDPTTRQQGMQEQRYPLPGDPNPVVTLHVADVSDPKAPLRTVDTSAYPDQDRLIVRFGWTPSSNQLLLEIQNRTQTRLDLLTADRNGGKTTPLFQETTAAWVEPSDLPAWLKDGTFLWQSERSGWRHLYHYKADGTLMGAVTSGEWEIRDFYGVSQPESGVPQVYFSAAIRASTGNDLFRVGLDGKGEPERLTKRLGSHQIRLNPSFTLYLDTTSDLWTPPQLRLFSLSEGNHELRLLADNAAVLDKLKPYAISRPELMTIKARDGFPLEAILIKPTNFDPTKRYPVYQEAYAGPGISTVRNSWSGTRGLFYQMLAQKGYVVWLCDNRSASGKGAKSQWTIYKNLGEGELRDVEDGLAWLKQQPWVDGDRVALYGWSYGGFFVQYALTHSKSFKLGIAGAGVSDWSLYDTIYTERYLDLPSANPEGYKKSAPINSASNLSGKILLLHGLADDNVHLQNTLQMVYALEQAEKQYELALYPRSRHGIGEPTLARHLQQRILDFLTANL